MIRFDHKPGLVIYLTAGDPSLDSTREIAIAAIDAGADVLELGVPFSDPLAKEIRAARPQAGLVVFSYFNPILRYGLKAFAADAAAAGVDGVLATDMIVEESHDYLAALDVNGLAPVFLAAPTSTDQRLEAIAAHTRGFIYAISRTGITGKQQTMTSDAEALVGRIRRWSKLPVAVGFGISNAEHEAQVGRFADAAVIGSAIVELIERSAPEEAPGAVARFIKGLR